MKQPHLFHKMFFVFVILSALHLINLVSAQEIRLEQVAKTGHEITCFASDDEGLMWIGTVNGLYRFDGKHLTELSFDRDDSNNNFSNRITCLHYNSYGLWAGTKQGLFLINVRKKENRKIINDEIKNFSKEDIYGDKNLWIHSNNRLYYISNPDSMPILYNISYTHTAKRYSANVVLISSMDGLWLYDDQLKIKKRQLSTSYTENIWCDSQYIWAVQQKQVINKFSWLGGNEFVFITDDLIKCTLVDDSLIFIGSRVGLKIANKFSGEVTFATNEPYNIAALYKDKSEFLWIGTKEGKVYIWIKNQPIYTHYQYQPNIRLLPSKHITALAKGKGNYIWVGTDKGFCRLDYINDVFDYHEKYNPPYSENIGLLDDYILSLSQIDNDNLIIGTKKAIQSYNIKTKRYKFISEDIIEILRQDNENKLWAGGWNGFLGIIENQKIIKDFSNRSFGCVYDIYSQSQDSLVFVATLHGMKIFEKKENELLLIDPIINPELLSKDNTVFGIYKDHRENIWAGGYNNLYIYTPQIYGDNNGKYNISLFNDEIGEPREGESLLFGEIFRDKFNQIWLLTDKGLLVNEQDEKEGITVSTHNIFSNVNFNFFEEDEITFGPHSAYIQIDDKNIFLASDNGLFRITPNKMKQDGPKRLFFSLLTCDGKTPVDIIYEKQIEIPPGTKRFSIQTASLPNNQKLMRYILFDSLFYGHWIPRKDWTLLSEDGIITFENLKPGEYHLFLQGDNAYHRILTIYVQDYWYNNPWIIFGSITFVLLLTFFSFYHVRMKYFQKKKNKEAIEVHNKLTNSPSLQIKNWKIESHIIYQGKEGTGDGTWIDVVNDYVLVAVYDVESSGAKVSHCASWVAGLLSGVFKSLYQNNANDIDKLKAIFKDTLKNSSSKDVHHDLAVGVIYNNSINIINKGPIFICWFDTLSNQVIYPHHNVYRPDEIVESTPPTTNRYQIQQLNIEWMIIATDGCLIENKISELRKESSISSIKNLCEEAIKEMSSTDDAKLIWIHRIEEPNPENKP